MKLSEVNKIALSKTGNEDVIIVNQVIADGDNKKIIKTPLLTNSIATKEDFEILTNQNTQLIKIISALTNKFTELDGKVNEINKQLANVKKLETATKKLEKKINELNDKINDETIEY